MPVPPVVMTTSAAVRADITVFLTAAASSFTSFRRTTSCPAAFRSSTMAAPLVSVASVRVSLMVTTAQRTEAGASFRCSGALTGVSIVRAGGGGFFALGGLEI